MFKEYPRVSQEKTGWRRLFSSEPFDLYIWYDKPQGTIIGFQLVELSGAESRRALTWEKAKGAMYAGVLTRGNFNASPVLVANGTFRSDLILKQFRAIDATLPLEIRTLVNQVIEDYHD